VTVDFTFRTFSKSCFVC